jgi:CRP-like cAMP-binding protein
MQGRLISDHPLIRQLLTVCPVSDTMKEVLTQLPMQIITVEEDREIVREGDRSSRCCLVLEGFVISFKITSEGKRQIVTYHLPGDIPDLQSLHLPVLDTSLATITPCTLGFIQHEALHVICESHPEVAKALWRWTLIAASIYREWVTNVGQRRSTARMAHVLCEMLIRMRAVGLAEGYACEMPMTQNELADATGMSTVHVNRTLQDLRRSKLITLKENTLTAIDWDGLQAAGEFDPAYLHIRDVVAS